jgi:hypothetical protein
VKGFDQTDTIEFLAASVKQVTKTAVIGLHTYPVGDEHRPHEHDGRVNDKHIEIAALDFFDALQILFAILNMTSMS